MKTLSLLAPALALALAWLPTAYSQIILPPLPPAAEEAEEPEKPMKPRGQVDQLLDMGSFERPLVKERTPWNKGGNPAPRSAGEWISLQPNAVAAKEGRFQAGVTSEIARTGRQSLFIAYNKTETILGRFDLSSTLHLIAPDHTYRISLWGRMDKQNPITIDQRIPSMRLQVEFYRADRKTQTGEAVIKAQTLPGLLNRGFVFTPDKWTEFMADVESPSDAKYMRVVWSWLTPTDPGFTDGTIYFDDAGIFGERPEPSLEEELATPDELREILEGLDAAEGQPNMTAPAPGEAAPPASPAPASPAAPAAPASPAPANE